MTGTLLIDGKVVEATHFAFDGHTRIYLIDSGESMWKAIICGYTKEPATILPVRQLERVWNEAGRGRFISGAVMSNPVNILPGNGGEHFIEWVQS